MRKLSLMMLTVVLASVLMSTWAAAARVPSINCLAASPDNRLLAAAMADGTVTVWDAATFKVKFAVAGDRSSAHCIAFSPDSATLAVSRTSGLSLLDALTGKEGPLALDQPATQAKPLVKTLVFSQDGKTMYAAGYADTIRQFDLTTGKLAQTLTLSGKVLVRTMALSPDASQLLVGTSDYMIRLIDLPALTPRRTLAAHTANLLYTDFSTDGKRWLTASSDGTFITVDTKAGETTEVTLGVDSARCYAVSGTLIAIGGDDHTIKIWDTNKEALVKTIAEADGHATAVSAITFTKDGRYLVSGSVDGVVKIWNTPDFTPAAVLTALK